MKMVIFANVIIVCLILRVSLATADNVTLSKNIKKYIGQICYNDEYCPEPLQCSDTLQCVAVECFDCSIYRRSKSKKCPTRLRGCGPCWTGYVQFYVNSLPRMPYCLSTPVNMKQALQLAENPVSYYVIHDPTYFKIVIPNFIRPHRVIIGNYTRRICDTDEDCPESEYCSEGIFCAKGFDCRTYNRLNSKKMKCAIKPEDCGPCMPGYLNINSDSDASFGEPCMRQNLWLKFHWWLRQLRKSYHS